MLRHVSVLGPSSGSYIVLAKVTLLQVILISLFQLVLWQHAVLCCVVLRRVSCYGCAFCVSWRDPYLAMFKMRCGIPNAYILDITMYKMHVSLWSYCTSRILISKTLTGTYGGGYTYVFDMCCYRTLLTYLLHGAESFLRS